MTVRRLPLIVLVLIMAGGAVLGAQRFMRRSRAPLREPTAESFDGGFTFCRGMYTCRSQESERRRLDDRLSRRRHQFFHSPYLN